MSVQPDAASRSGASSIPGNSPKQHLQVSSIVNLRANVEWNVTVRYVARLAAPDIASYVGADTTLRWRPSDNLEVSVTGQNLLSPGHMEFGDLSNILFPTQVRRSAFAKLTWRF